MEGIEKKYWSAQVTVIHETFFSSPQINTFSPTQIISYSPTEFMMQYGFPQGDT